MKKLLTFLKNVFVSIFIYALYIWYRCAMFIVITKPIQTIDQWYTEPKDQTKEYWIMVLFAAFSISFYFFGFWYSILIYTILLILNIGIYATYKAIQKVRNK